MAELGQASGRDGHGPWAMQLKLAARPATVPESRAILRQLLCEWRLETIADTATLLMSELVTNAVKASANGVSRDDPGDGQIIVATVQLTDTGLLLEVWDANPDPPVVQDVDPASDGGRGLLMIEYLGDKWGYHASAGGKVVWCEVALPS